MNKCRRCNGTGQITVLSVCWQCTGRGWVDGDLRRDSLEEIPCLTCAGEGERPHQTGCPDCRGTGLKAETRTM